jgi:hypothetical protein
MKNERSGVSRRGVIKSVAAAVVVGPVVAAAGGVRGPSALAKAAPRGPRVTGPLRVGLIGCGGRGTGAAVQALRADPETVLVAMGDAFADRLNSSHGAIVEAMGDSAEARVQVPEEKRFVGFGAYQKVIEAGCPGRAERDRVVRGRGEEEPRARGRVLLAVQRRDGRRV